MIAIREFVKLDYLAFKDWFRKQTISKVIIATVYLLVLIGVGLGIYFWSDAFIKYVVPYESFGLLTSQYILRGSFTLLMWVGIFSSLISTLTFLLTPDRHLDLLLTFPLSTLSISLKASARSALINLSLFLISVFPLVLAFTKNFFGSLLSLILLVIITQTFGSSLGYLFYFLFRKKYGRLIAITFGVSMILATGILLKVTFPPQLRLLDDIPAETFSAFFNSLPLIRDCWLSGEIIKSTDGLFGPSVLFYAFTLVTIMISLLTQICLFVPCRQSQRVHTSSTIKIKSKIGHFRRISLISKDLLSFFRNPKDVSYLLFLIIMIVSFFGLFSRGYLARGVTEKYLVDAVVFSFAWLIFFSGTYVIRLSYPLMVNEGQSKWWLFTLPIASTRILQSKVSSSLILSLPLLSLGLLEWQILPFSVNTAFFVLLSVIGITSLAVALPLIGSLFLDFTACYNPEKASTSLSGLLSVVFVCSVGALGGYLASQFMGVAISPATAINAFLTESLVVTAFVWFLAIRYLERYKLDI